MTYHGGVLTPRTLTAAAWMALTGVLLAVAAIVALLAGVRLPPLLVDGATIVLSAPGVVLGIAVLGREAVQTQTEGTQRPYAVGVAWSRVFRALPPWARVAALAGFLAGGFAIATAASLWSPEIDNGQYVLRNHTTVRVVDRTTYDREVNKHERFMLGIYGTFAVGGASMCAAGAVKARRGPRMSL